MDQSKIGKNIPEAPKPGDLGFKGGVIQGFPVQGNATENEFCSCCSAHKDSCKCSGGCKK